MGAPWCGPSTCDRHARARTGFVAVVEAGVLEDHGAAVVLPGLKACQTYLKFST